MIVDLGLPYNNLDPDNPISGAGTNQLLLLCIAVYSKVLYSYSHVDIGLS